MDPRLAQVALELGADVPVCLRSRTALMRGIGEELTFVDDLPHLDLVLVNPGEGVSTADVFAQRTGSFTQAADWPDAVEGREALIAELAARTNDLQPPAQDLSPVIEETLASLAAQPGCLLARMSGSGATCFGIFADTQQAADAATAIAAVWHEGWAVACRTRG